MKIAWNSYVTFFFSKLSYSNYELIGVKTNSMYTCCIIEKKFAPFCTYIKFKHSLLCKNGINIFYKINKGSVSQ